ncbi:MAG TPA: YetF domain-containing protein [Egibacteraceae bacterium]|nr:YetF domain-containing protein [Egibacteraceae bacterium]
MLFQDLQTLGRIVLVALLGYAAFIVVLRVSGKRTLSKLNAFDLVVTVALGSTLATLALSADVALAEGITVLVMLVGLQYLIASLTVRWRLAGRLVKSSPTLLVRDGQMIDAALDTQRVTRGEILQVLRRSGLGSVAEAAAVVLETDGSLSVIASTDQGDRSTLSDVDGWAPQPHADQS